MSTCNLKDISMEDADSGTENLNDLGSKASGSRSESEQGDSNEHQFQDHNINVQASEISSSSLFIKRNLSLYQQLTKGDERLLALPRSQLEKRSIQAKWTAFPSPFQRITQQGRKSSGGGEAPLKRLTPKRRYSKRMKLDENLRNINGSPVQQKNRPNRGHLLEFPGFCNSKKNFNSGQRNNKLGLGPKPISLAGDFEVIDRSCISDRTTGLTLASTDTGHANEQKPSTLNLWDNPIIENVKSLQYKQDSLIIRALQTRIKYISKENENLVCTNEKIRTLIDIKAKAANGLEVADSALLHSILKQTITS